MNFPFYIAKRIVRSSTSGYSGALVKLAIASIALSVAVMLLSTSVIKGFKNEISEKIYGFWGHIHITDTHSTRNFELRPILNDTSLKDSILSIGFLEYTGRNKKNKVLSSTKGGVKSMSPFITFPSIISTREDLEAIILKGINPEYDQEVFSKYLKEGSFPALSDSVASRDIIVSMQTAKRLNLKLNDPVDIHFIENKSQIKRRVKVGGIYKTGLEEYDRKFAFVDMRLIQRVIGWSNDQVSGFEIFVDDVEDAEVIADYVYNEVLPSHLYAQTIQEKQSGIFEWLELQDINETMILMLMILVAIINMSTGLLILILERSTMIGVLKSLGQTDWGVRKIFIISAVYIMGLALLFGNILGIGFGLLQKTFGFLTLDEANYYLTEVPIEFDILSILFINVGAIVVTIIAMLFPTFLVTRIKPIEILRFD